MERFSVILIFIVTFEGEETHLSTQNCKCLGALKITNVIFDEILNEKSEQKTI